MSAPQLGPDSRPKRHPDSAYRAIGDEGGLVVLPGKSEVKVLNPVGTAVYARLDGISTLGEIARAVTEEFDVSESEALRDAVAFVSELARNGMLADPEETA